jgi:probable F420-dependent oxidoreductase
VTPEHTATAREILGPNPVLAPEQMVILQDDPAEARRIARRYLAPYLAQPDYQNSLRRLGFTDDDFEGDGTDRDIDVLVAWGDEDAILKRIRPTTTPAPTTSASSPLPTPPRDSPSPPSAG